MRKLAFLLIFLILSEPVMIHRELDLWNAEANSLLIELRTKAFPIKQRTFLLTYEMYLHAFLKALDKGDLVKAERLQTLGFENYLAWLNQRDLTIYYYRNLEVREI